MTDKTFVKITNTEIYKQIEQFKEQNSSDHNVIIQRLDRTNGKVKLGFWVATTGLSIALIVVGLLFQHMNT